MIFTANKSMQPGEKIVFPRRSRIKKKETIKPHHLSSFGILNRNGLEITNGVDPPDLEELIESNNLPEFSDWSMPEERHGYIKCKAHDFL
jgi:hypothetical protein